MNKKKILITSIFLSTTIIFTPHIVIAKEKTLSNFLTKFFSSKSLTQSEKNQIFKTDIDTLNIHYLLVMGVYLSTPL